MQQDLRIALCAEAATLSRQMLAKLAEVVYLAVEGDGDTAILAGHWLVRASGIDDGQAGKAHRASSISRDEMPPLVWPAMPQAISHAHRSGRQARASSRAKLRRLIKKLSCKSAHEPVL